MKFAICIAIVFLTSTLGRAQMPATANKPQILESSVESGDAGPSGGEDQQLLAAALLHSYATSVNNLLGELASHLQVISQHAAAGELSQQNALLLKLAATRSTIARLETLSAVYGAQLVSMPDVAADSNNSALNTLGSKNTVSVKELQRESAK
jgi:hypothetical protein